jgi:hypothetical protein
MSIPANRLRSMVQTSQSAIGPLALSARNAGVAQSTLSLPHGTPAASGLISPAASATRTAGVLLARAAAQREGPVAGP